MRPIMLVATLCFALPAAAQTGLQGSTSQARPQTTWQQGSGWQPVPGAPQGLQNGLSLGNSLSPELSDNYARMRQQRMLNERMDSGSALILQGVIPRSSR